MVERKFPFKNSAIFAMQALKNRLSFILFPLLSVAFVLYLLWFFLDLSSLIMLSFNYLELIILSVTI